MRSYFSEGGRTNPDFRYKVRVTLPCPGAMQWCEEYPTKTLDGCFERYYTDWRNSDDSNYVIFQFEQEEPAIMFALKFCK